MIDFQLPVIIPHLRLLRNRYIVCLTYIAISNLDMATTITWYMTTAPFQWQSANIYSANQLFIFQMIRLRKHEDTLDCITLSMRCLSSYHNGRHSITEMRSNTAKDLCYFKIWVFNSPMRMLLIFIISVSLHNQNEILSTTEFFPIK